MLEKIDRPVVTGCCNRCVFNLLPCDLFLNCAQRRYFIVDNSVEREEDYTLCVEVYSEALEFTIEK